MPLVVAGVTRFAVNAHNSFGAGEPVVNILDFIIDTTGTALTRAQANEACAGNIINAWVEHVIPLLTDTYTFESVSWVDLDSATGDVGSRSSTSLHTLPENGGTVAEANPSNAAVLVTKAVQTSRGQRNGRMFIGQVPAADTSNNTLIGGNAPAWQPAFSDLLDELNDEPITPVNFDRSLCVVHTTGANPQTGTAEPVTALNVQTRLATQRRRLR